MRSPDREDVGVSQDEEDAIFEQISRKMERQELKKEERRRVTMMEERRRLLNMVKWRKNMEQKWNKQMKGNPLNSMEGLSKAEISSVVINKTRVIPPGRQLQPSKFEFMSAGLPSDE